jgi:multiple antibiotic resistance protein
MGKAIGEMFGALFPVVAPIPMAPVFVSMTAHSSSAERMRIALKSSVLVFGLLVVFLFVGEPLLHAFGISLEALEIAGGIVVGLTGLAMVQQPVIVAKVEHDGDISFSPLAIPLLAGPGAFGVLMALEARRASNLSLVGFVIAIALISVSVYVCFVFSAQIVRCVGPAPIDALRRIFGLIVMALGVEMVVFGINNHELLKHGLGH